MTINIYILFECQNWGFLAASLFHPDQIHMLYNTTRGYKNTHKWKILSWKNLIKASQLFLLLSTAPALLYLARVEQGCECAREWVMLRAAALTFIMWICCYFINALRQSCKERFIILGLSPSVFANTHALPVLVIGTRIIIVDIRDRGHVNEQLKPPRPADCI